MEIKEILDDLKDEECYYANVDGRFHIDLNKDEASLLLDYITNLQQENERLKELCDKYEEEHSNEFQCWKRDRKELLDKRARIEKAVECLKQTRGNHSDLHYEPIKVFTLINILNGRSDE